MRRIAGAVLIATGVVALLLALTPATASAVAPEQAGWWFELQTKQLPAPLPSPPNVPDGGLFVQQGAQGPVAYSAVRFPATDAASAILTLTAAQGSTTTLGALRACATSSSWSPPTAAPGAWEDAPKYGTNCTLGAISSDQKYVAFFFGSGFFTGGALDVAIVPQDGVPPFAIAFDKPAADSLAVKAAAASTPSVSTPSVSSPTPSAPAVSGSASRPATATTQPVAPTKSVPPPDQRSDVATNVLNVAGLGDPDRGARALALGGAALIVVGWWLSSTRAVPMPRLLGALAGGGTAPVDTALRTGGVGRFARTRDRDARSLR